jgi:hypothetical protein
VIVIGLATALLLTVALAGASCTDAPAPAAPEENRQLQTASQGLCDAQVLTSEGRIREAASVFQADTHDYLHELARRLQDVDPASAAELLEAKQRVERALAESRDPPGTQDLLVRLQRALGDAAAEVDLPAPLCREGAV